MRVETLIEKGSFSKSTEWARIRKEIHAGIQRVDWPRGSGKFTIHPESGKKHGQGNGVGPIKRGLMTELGKAAWKLEEPLKITSSKRPGKLDAVLYTDGGPFALEWETGNISSSHRALNKMALGLLKEKLIGGTLVIPTRNLYQYLTDRVGNWDEIEPYVDLWKALPISNGVLEIVIIEHDATSLKSPRIPKATDGRALR